MIFARDDNRKTTSGGVSTQDSVTPQTFMVDPVSLRLLVSISVTSDAGAVIPSEVGHDQNRRTTGYGVTNDANENLSPLLIDHVNNYLYVDLILG